MTKVKELESKREMYVIKDQETGNYCTELSFQWHDKKGTEVTYSSETGRANGMRYYASEEQAQEIVDELQKENERLNAGIIFQIVKVDIDELPLGKTIFKTFMSIMKSKKKLVPLAI